MKPLTIGSLARQSGVNRETVRYYERLGLLPKPPRTSSGYRVFSVETAQRLRFIRRAKELGFSLREIQEILSLRASPVTTREEIHARARAKIVDIEARIKSLRAMRKSLRKLTQSCDGCGTLGDCPILESLNKWDV